jgi:hypothetical protein
LADDDLLGRLGISACANCCEKHSQGKFHVRFQLRLLKTQLDALDAAVKRLQSEGRLSMTVTDALREGADLWLAAHPAPKAKRSKGGA